MPHDYFFISFIILLIVSSCITIKVREELKMAEMKTRRGDDVVN